MGEKREAAATKSLLRGSDSSITLASRPLRFVILSKMDTVTHILFGSADIRAGGLLRAIRMIKDAKRAESHDEDLVADLHPDRPAYRCIALPEHIISLEADPTFEEIKSAGAVVDKRSEPHTVLDDFFLVSGEIPRVTPYETGLKNAVRYDPDENDWFSDEVILDERSLICNLKGTYSLKPAHSLIALTIYRKGSRCLHWM